MPEGIVKVSKVYRDENGVPTLGTPERIAGTEVTAITAPTGPGPVPTVTTAPAITGTPTVGQTLTLSAGTYTGSPTFIRQWFADGVAIPGATGLTLVLAAGQQGKRINARVVATNAYGSVNYETPQTAVVAAA